jgi:hypothetical protein
MTIRITRVDRFPEGREKRVDLAATQAADPAVLSRLESRPPAGPCEVATGFRPTAERPATYPAALPFVAHAESHTNEYPDSARSPRVRWVTAADPDRIFDDVARQSVAAGWRTDTSQTPQIRSAVRTLFLRRDEGLRRISQHEFEGLAIIELEDVLRRMP